MKEVVVWVYTWDGWDEIDSISKEVFKVESEALKRAREIEESIKKYPRYQFGYGPYVIEVREVRGEKVLRKVEIGYYWNDPEIHFEVKEGE